MTKGTAVALVQSGPPVKRWDCAREGFVTAMHDKTTDGKTSSERHGPPFDRPSFPFGAFVECIPIAAKDRSRVHQYVARVGGVDQVA